MTSLAQVGGPRRIALVTQGFGVGGGIPSAVRWLRDGLESSDGYTVDIHDLAASSKDANSRRATRPRSWIPTKPARPLRRSPQVASLGANLVEVEPMRYRARSELTHAVEEYDLIQVVAGAPALATAVTRAAVPVVIQVATSVRWERQATRAGAGSGRRLWRRCDDELGDSSRTGGSPVRRCGSGDERRDARLRGGGRSAQRREGPSGVDTDRFRPLVAGGIRTAIYFRYAGWATPANAWTGFFLPTMNWSVSISTSRPWCSREGRPSCLHPRSDGEARPDIACGDPPGCSTRRAGAALQGRVRLRPGVAGRGFWPLGAGGHGEWSTRRGYRHRRFKGMRGRCDDGLAGLSIPEPGLPRSFAERVSDVLQVSGPSMALAGRLRCEQSFSTKIALTQITGLYERILGSA